ncbi:MAG: flagellar hook-length control protein FliK [Candidatus Accumulibacter sp.]|jgi:flagellar hook-length control protein FliK|nr:flagellar hook-length control protein FliK [Accumulibacter sp.]
MTLAIVSALPKSAPPPSASLVEGSDAAGLGQDFICLLFGQLNAAQPDAGLILGTAPEPVAGDFGDDPAEGSDPTDLLAVLVQAPLERRGDVALPDDAALSGNAALPDDVALPEKTPSVSLTGVFRESPGDERLSMAGRLARDVPQEGIPLAKSAPANEPAAKFAVLPEAAPVEQNVSVREPTGLSTLVAPTANTPARVNDAPPAIPVPTSLHDRGWNDDFAQKVSWIAGQRHQFAELTLNPPALGNIEISLKLDSDKSSAVATFVSSNAEVRESIETALPKLREMLAGVGIELGQANVSAESFRQAAGNGQNPGQGASPSGDDVDILAPDPQADRIAAPAADRGHGLVDMFV